MNGFELNDNDVVSMENPGFNTGQTFKISELKEKVREFANIENKNGYLNRKVQWFTNEGVGCEVLTIEGGGWQKGKLRFKLEFIPDQPQVQPQDTNSLTGLRFDVDI